MKNRINRIFLIPLLALIGICSLSQGRAMAQGGEPTKAETKLYGKTVSKPSVKACNKFLKTYPQSVYAKQLTDLRDSLIFFVETDRQDAVAVENFTQQYPQSRYTTRAEELLETLDTPETTESEAWTIATETIRTMDAGSAEALPFRYRNREYIAIFQAMAPDLAFGSVRISIIGKTGEGWEMSSETEIDKYISSEAMNRSVPVEKAQTLRIHGKKMLQFSYINYTAGNPRNLEYVANLIGIDGKDNCSAMFYGVNLSKDIPQKGEAFTIEGRSPETMAQGGLSREQAYLMEKLAGNKDLKKISEADALTDDAIAWWLAKNPKAMANAQTLTFGNLPEECSLVFAFKKARKENSKSFQAAVIDLRGYTVVVSLNKTTGKYILVWAETECKNKKKDRYLADIYFESNGSTLDLFYYKGKTTFKYHISLLAKTIRRQ